MVKLVALFKHPEDAAAFDQHYHEVHAPLMRVVPGLRKLEVTRFTSGVRGEKPEYYMMAEMYWDDKAALDEAMTSAQNRAAGKDLMSFAREYVTMMFADVEE
jgi:uncharacterized protein (TIGR02118 family)